MNKCILIVLMLLFVLPVVFAVPQAFSVNGKLTDTSGNVLQGSYTINFSIYKVPSGGTALWSSTGAVVTDTNGVYNERLIGVDLNFTDQYYLGIKVESDSEMTPRINLSSSGYAFRANSSEGLDSWRSYTVGGLNVSGSVERLFEVGNTSDSVLFVNGSSGRVGIGTSAPSSRLHILSEGTNTVPLRVVKSSGGTDLFSIQESNGGNSILNLKNSVGSPSTYIVAVGDSYHLSGDFGFGDTTPDAHLEVSANGDSGGAVFMVSSDDNNDGDLLMINESGNVGIGTQTPSNKLDVRGTGNFSGTIYINNATDVSTLGGNPVGTEGAVQINTGGSLGGNASQLFVNSTTGNVGIGTATPGSVLHIAEQDNEATTPSLSFGDGDTGLFESADDRLDVSVGGSSPWTFRTDQMGRAGRTLIMETAPSATSPGVVFDSTDIDTGVGRAGADIVSLIAGGVNVLNAVEVGSKGYVGINTQTPLNRLDVQGNASINNTLYVTEDGRVGIGIDSPAQKLEVVGGARPVRIDRDGSYNAWEFGLTTDSLYFRNVDTATNVMYLNGNGNVGIGTTAPNTTLHVSGNINVTSGNDVCIEGGSCLSSAAGVWSESGSIATYNGGINANNTLYVNKSTGRVGIGTATPSNILHVSKSGGVAMFSMDLIEVDSTGDAMITIDKSAANKRAAVEFETNSNSDWFFGTPDSDIVGNGDEFFLSTDLTASGIKFFVETSGNIGIGTTSPSHKLDVNGSINISGANAAIIFPDGTNMTTSASAVWSESGSIATYNGGINVNNSFYVNHSSGRVGIGNANPSVDLEVKSSAANTVFFQLTASDGIDLFKATESAGGDIILQMRNTDGTLKNQFISSGSSYINSGNLGIGNSAPSSKLEVGKVAGKNEINMSGVLYVNSTSGRVGIGTAAPAAELEVNGDIRYKGDLRMDNNKKLSFYGSQPYYDFFKDYDSPYYLSLRYYASPTPGAWTKLMTFDINGRVGIGTATPTQKLEVNGTAGGLLVDVSGTNPMINTTSNNVTITSTGGSVVVRLG